MDDATPPDATAPECDHRAAVAAALRLIRDKYMFPDKGAAVAGALGTRLAAGGYDGLPDDRALAERVTRDLYDLTDG